MKLAEGRPLRRRMMAAMAQQDCGQCGYNCEDYSDALFAKKEERLNLCVPGGKDTARMLKKLYAELGSRAAPRAKPAPAAAAPAQRGVRAGPLPRQSGRRDLRSSRRGSTRRAPAKETWHVEFDLADSGLDYTVGDSSASFPPTIPRWSMR